MRRHTILAYFGATQDITLDGSDSDVVTLINLTLPHPDSGRLVHWISRVLHDMKGLGVTPSEIGVDLLVLATLVYAADTRISRRTESQDTWTREIRLEIPVSNPAQWAAVSGLLTEMLDFLTGDHWSLSFRPRPNVFRVLVPTLQLPKDDVFEDLCLFSGGLDSLIGAIDLLQTGRRVLFLSHAGESATSEAQNACIERLQANYDLLSRLRLWMVFPKQMIGGVSPESTTRGRSFLFFSLGAVAASGFGKSVRLWVPENGLIALNVPLDPLRLGSNSTRTTHPFYMGRWNQILNELGIPAQVDNPYWNRTKGEMVAECKNHELLKKVLSVSLSCSSPSKGRWQGLGVQHCGYCLPCLIRRAALEKALGRGRDPTSYASGSLRSRILSSRRAEGKQIRSLQVAMARLSKNPGLERFLIHKPGPLSGDVSRLRELAHVYRRGMAELETFLTGVRTSPR